MRSGLDTAKVIRDKAAELFFEKGYDATTLREVATAAGLKVGSLYNHIASKEDLLLQVMGGIIDDLVELQQQALGVEGDAVERLRAVIECHMRFHAERARAVYIGNTNVRSLSEGPRAEIVAKRSAYERILEAQIEAAGDAGLVQLIDARLHAYSIVAQGFHVAGWYREGGRKSLDDIVADYTKIALRELKVVDADERVDVARAPAEA
jgi:AcrR family transcriptional regulator